MRGLQLFALALLAGLSFSFALKRLPVAAAAAPACAVGAADITSSASGHNPARPDAMLPRTPSARPDVDTRQRVRETYGALALNFEANQGQTDAQVKFFARGNGYALFLTPTEAVLQLQHETATAAPNTDKPQAAVRQPRSASPQPAALRMKFLGGNPAPQMSGVDLASGRVNYFTGNDATQWRTNVPTYAKVLYRELYPGIDLAYYGNQQRLEYDFLLAPGSRPETIKLAFEGAHSIRINRQGELVLRLADGEVRQPKPVVYQEVAGGRRQIAGAYVLTGRQQVGIRVGAYDRTRPLVIDPMLIYSTYLGGSSGDHSTAIAVDADGNAYVAGITASANFPTVGAIQGTRNGVNQDAYVAKLNAAGSAFIYATYLGGSTYDVANSIALDQAGNAYVTGDTQSTDFPTVQPLQATLRGFDNAFIAKLNPAGSALVYSTYLGGSGYDFGDDIAVDTAGNAYVAGGTNSDDFPTVNPFQAAKRDSLFFKSADGGGHWIAAGTGLQRYEVFTVVVDPTTPANIYAGTDEGLYKSSDGGGRWRLVNSGEMEALAIDPTNPTVLYASGLLGLVYKSTDGGNSWSAISSDLFYVRSLVVDSLNPATLYASTEYGVYKSTNGGITWRQSSNGIINRYVYIVVIDPTNPATLYAGTDNGVYKTTDGGGVWRSANTGLPFFPVAQLVLARSNPATLYAISYNGVYKSDNGGQSWAIATPAGVPDFDLIAIAVAPTDANTVYTAGYTSGIYKSIDGGNSWQFGNAGFTSKTVQALAVDPTNAANVYAGTTGNQDAFIAKLNATGTALTYATYLGGSEMDGARTLAVGSDGSAYVAGYTASNDFPVVNPLQAQNKGGADDGYIAKLNPAGTALTYATYLGGSDTDIIYALSLDAGGNVYVTGSTLSFDYPTVNPIQSANSGGGYRDAFVTKLNSAGSALSYSTYLGGTREDYARSIGVNQSGEAYVVGQTNSPDFPLLTPLRANLNGFQDAFITKLNANGSTLNFSTYLGGANSEQAYGVALDAAGSVYVTGNTSSTDFPTVNPAQPTNHGVSDAFILKLAAVPDLALTMSDAPDPVVLGSNLTYTISVANVGDLRTTGVRVSDTLPAGATFVSATASQGACTGAGPVTCDVGTLNGGAQASITIVITPPAVRTITNTAVVNANESELNTANNTATQSTVVDLGALNVFNFSAGQYNAGEGDRQATITVIRAGDISSPATVTYRTIDNPAAVPCNPAQTAERGIAYARCDYVTTINTLSFAPNEAAQSFVVPLIDDAHVEGNETFTVALFNPSAGTGLGAQFTATITIVDNDTTAGANPIYATPFFVRMQYLDFLSREPEAGEPWSGVLNRCADVNNLDPNSPSAGCDRLSVSAAFFGSPEFQLKGYYVYRFYKLAFNRLPDYAEIIPDMSSLAGATPQAVYQQKAQLASAFSQRPEFVTSYGSQTNAAYVTALLSRYQLATITTPNPQQPDGTTKETLTSDALTTQLGNGTLTRAQVLRAIADSDQVFQAEYNQAFVAMQYYGYLRRTPEPAGYQSWLTYLTTHSGDFRTMVNGFMNSTEYRLRFGLPQ